MRRFVNPGNTAFEVAVNSQIYVDKTGLLAYTNSVINTGHIILIGINYDKKTKEHSCKIERFERVLQKSGGKAHGFNRGMKAKKLFAIIGQ